MPRMIRKQIYLAPEQDAILKQRARILGVSEAEVIRRVLEQKAFSPGHMRDLQAWERERAYIEDRMASAPVGERRKFDRDAAYEERLNRYGR